MSVKHSILVVEDEKAIGEVLKLNLELDGFEVIYLENGKDAVSFVYDQDIDLIIMDVMLPEMNGIEASQKIKKIRPDLPIIILSALDQSIDRIKGLKAGADDYVNKPFNYEELLLRIQKQLNRNNSAFFDSNTIKIGNSIVHLASSTLRNSSNTYNLNPKELALIKYLYENKNRVVSREELYANVWGYTSFPNSRTVDNYISAIRKYLTDEEERTEYILSERGIGYKLLI